MFTYLRFVCLLLFGITVSIVYAQQHPYIFTPIYNQSCTKNYHSSIIYEQKIPTLSQSTAPKTLDLAPISLETQSGEHSQQNLSVLATETQHDKEDNWQEYQAFFISNKGYIGTFVYQLPSNYRSNDILTLNLLTNYKGASQTEQTWQWKIYNYQQQQWQLLGNNDQANDWQWTHLEFPIIHHPQHFISPNGQFKIRYVSGEHHYNDVSTLDLLSLRVNLDKTK